MRNRLILIVTTLAAFALQGCTLHQWAKDVVKDSRVKATVGIAARRVATAAAGAVLQAAVGQLDREKKADFLDGLSSALWSQVPEVIHAGAVEEIARAWTPERTHWEDLAGTLASDFAERQPQSREEALKILYEYADGLAAAAASERAP